MGKYPVIFLSFKGVEGLTYDEAFDAFVRVIGKEISRVSFLADSDKLTMLEREQYKGLTIIEDGSFVFSKDKLISSLQLLSQMLYKHYDQKVVGYSCAAEPPVQYRLSHLSRRSEPLIKHTICMMRIYSRNALSNPYTSRMEISCSASMLVMLMR